MLTRIVQNSPQLCAFLDPLIGNLSAPQSQHLRDLCDSLLVCESAHTLANLQRQLVSTTDASNWADFLRISPWQTQTVREKLLQSQLAWALAEAEKKGQAKELYLNLDDSLGEKDKRTWRLEPVDWHHDHNESTPKRPRYKKSFCYLACTLSVGSMTLTLDIRLYLRARTVRIINRGRASEDRIRFRSKNSLAREMLGRIAPLLPPEWAVIVQFDSWYASNKLLKFVHRQHWQFTCATKSNRNLDGVNLDQHHRRLRHKHHTKVRVIAADQSEVSYYVRALDGQFAKLPIDLRVLISKRRLGQASPAFFATTRLECKPQAILQGYGERWSCEVVNWYLKNSLGLSDFRVRSYEAVDKYLVAVHLALAYVERRFAQERGPEIKCCGDLIRRHREEHTEAWLTAAVVMAQEGASLDQVLQRFLKRKPQAE
jgi:hypothetical protein